MSRRSSFLIFALAAALVVPGCRKKTQVQGVDMDVAFAAAQLSDNLITEATYTVKTGGDFEKIDRDLSVFVHYWHNENMILQDDFIPDPPTTQWEKGRSYVFKRRIYLPKFIDEFDPQFKGEETVRLSVGLYNRFDRSGKNSREVLAKKLTVVPPPLGTPEVIYESGWYDLEVDQNDPLKQWRWTAPEARCVIDNPRRDALLVIRGGANISTMKDQKVVFKINDQPFDEFIPAEALFEKSYPIKKEILGDKDEFVLTIAVDKPFVPVKMIANSKDERELGVQISFIYFR
jgi:hypothetical protein